MEGLEERLVLVRQALEGILEPGELQEIAEAQDFANLLRALDRQITELGFAPQGREFAEFLREQEEELGKLDAAQRRTLLTRFQALQAEEEYARVLDGLAESTGEYERSVASLNRVISEFPQYADAARQELARLAEEQRARSVEGFIDRLRLEREALRAVGDEEVILAARREAAGQVTGRLTDLALARIDAEALLTEQARRRRDVLDQLEGPLREYQQLEQAVARVIAEQPELTARANALLAQRRQELIQQQDPFTALLDSLQRSNALLREFEVPESEARSIQELIEVMGGLTEEQERQLRAALQTERALRTQQEIYNQIVGPARDYAEGQAAINAILDRYPELADQATQALIQLQLAFLQSERSFDAGVERALLTIENDFTNAAANIDNTITRAFSATEDALVQFVQTGKLEIADLVDTIIAEFARLVIRQAILGPLAGAFSGLFGFADGGQALLPRRLQYGGYISGPGGPRDDHVPALLSNGEFVINAAATRANRPLLEAINSSRRFQQGGFVAASGSGGASGIRINVFDQRTVQESEDAPVRVSSRRGPDGEAIADIVIPSVNRAIDEGRLDRPLGRRFGVRPRVGA